MSHHWHIMTAEECPHFTAWCGHLLHAGDRAVWFYDDAGKFDSDACESCGPYAIGVEKSVERKP